MIDFLHDKAIALILSAIPLGLISSLIYQGVKKATEGATNLIKNLPPSVHRCAFTLTATGMTALASLVGYPIQCEALTNCFEQLDQNMIQALLSALIASLSGMAAHRVTRKKPLNPA